jgi:hypothetical protein
MSNYEELSDEEYAAEMGRAFFDGELQHRSGRTWVLREDGLYLEPLKGRRYRRKPKPRRITGWMGVSPSLETFSPPPSHGTTCVYPRKEDVPKLEGFDIIYIDQEVPE